MDINENPQPNVNSASVSGQEPNYGLSQSDLISLKKFQDKLVQVLIDNGSTTDIDNASRRIENFVREHSPKEGRELGNDITAAVTQAFTVYSKVENDKILPR